MAGHRSSPGCVATWASFYSWLHNSYEEHCKQTQTGEYIHLKQSKSSVAGGLEEEVGRLISVDSVLVWMLTWNIVSSRTELHSGNMMEKGVVKKQKRQGTRQIAVKWRNELEE